MVRVGLIGAGIMGSGHARYITNFTPNGQVVAISDVSEDRMNSLAAEIGTVKFMTKDPQEIFNHPDLDAVLIASPDQLHAEHIRLGIKSGKAVLCEKPMGITIEEARAVAKEIEEHQEKVGKKLFSFGFMRRFDPAFRKLREEINSGKYGKPLFVQVVARNHESTVVRSEGLLTNMAIHDFDIYRWMFQSDWKSVQTFYPPHHVATPEKIGDPLIFVATLENGVILVEDVMANGSAGYDTRVEVVCEKGNIAIGIHGDVAIRTLENFEVNKGGKMSINWMDKFETAYIEEMKAWINEVDSGVTNPDLATHIDALRANEGAELGVSTMGKIN